MQENREIKGYSLKYEGANLTVHEAGTPLSPQDFIALIKKLLETLTASPSETLTRLEPDIDTHPEITALHDQFLYALLKAGEVKAYDGTEELQHVLNILSVMAELNVSAVLTSFALGKFRYTAENLILEIYQDDQHLVNLEFQAQDQSEQGTPKQTAPSAIVAALAFNAFGAYQRYIEACQRTYNSYHTPQYVDVVEPSFVPQNDFLAS